jgi:hypothetical protein
VPLAAPRSNPEWERRQAAAARWRPNTVKLLLVSAAPPADPEAYLYAASAGTLDPVAADVMNVLFEAEPIAGKRAVYQKELKRRGVFLIELKPDGPRASGDDLRPYADWLPTRVEGLEPGRVVLLGADVHRAAFALLDAAKIPVEDAKIAAAEAGLEAEGRGQLRAALVRAGLEALIRPLPPKARAELEA